MKRNGTPAETFSGASSSPARMSPGSIDRSDASSSTGGDGGPATGSFAAESWAKTGTPASERIRTGTGPTPSSKTIRVSSPVTGISPIEASTIAVPTVG